jgi:hypothetical protein
MVAGNWLNNDGLWLQFGTTKAVPELAGDYQMYGPWRELEAFIAPAATSFGTPVGQANSLPLPSSFQGTVASQTAAANTGIISYTTFFPLQPTAPVTAASGSVLSFVNPQIYISQIDLETFVTWSAGGGSGTGLTGVGLVVPLPVAGSNATAAWVQTTNPSGTSAGVQLLGATTIANSMLNAGRHWTFFADGTMVNLLTSPGTPIDTNYPVPGTFLTTDKGSLSITTPAEAFLPGGLPNNAYISAIVSGGQFTQATAGGLSSLRIKYRQMYSINDATQI